MRLIIIIASIAMHVNRANPEYIVSSKCASITTIKIIPGTPNKPNEIDPTTLATRLTGLSPIEVNIRDKDAAINAKAISANMIFMASPVLRPGAAWPAIFTAGKPL